MRGDTWEWNGNEWTQVADTGPPGRWGHTIVYDSDKQKVVLFGGLAGGNRILNDTWEWNGNEWTQVVGTGPSARGWHSMVYDSSNDLAVLFGGVSFTSPSFSGGTWKMKDNVWTKGQDIGPNPRGEATMVYANREQYYLVGAMLQESMQILGSGTELFGYDVRICVRRLVEVIQWHMIVIEIELYYSGGVEISDNLGDTWEALKIDTV
ncbi:MAG: kelch motif-containing protein [Thermoproteota archaeon]|nr:kelch motif-containing protein [Thermoproteota archaeon]